VRTADEVDGKLVRSNAAHPQLVENRLDYEQTIDDSSILSVNRRAKRAVIERRGGRQLPPDSLVMPEKWWFGKMGGEGRFWHDVIAPSSSALLSGIKGFHTRRLDHERMEIVRTDVHGELRLTASTRLWRVLDCTYEDNPAGGPRHYFTYKYSWTLPGGGLKRFSYTSEQAGRPGLQKRYEVRRLDLSRKPADSMFDTTDKRITDGFGVDNKVLKRSYIKGGRRIQVENRNATLEDLARRVRERGFLRRP
jgi:hypothetical protein